MPSKRVKLSLGLTLVLAGLLPTGASAQDETGVIGQPVPAAETSPTPPPPDGTTPAPSPTQLTPPMTSAPARVDGPRFRGGVAFTVGGEFFSNYDYSAMLFGIDGRFGVQLNDLIGFYIEPHLSFGGRRGSGYSGTTGTFATTAMVDFTFADTFFVGAGVGYIVFNNPSGPALAFRVGAYPAKSFAEVGPRRRGLVVSLETRVGFLGSVDGTGVQIMGAVGYETF